VDGAAFARHYGGITPQPSVLSSQFSVSILSVLSDGKKSRLSGIFMIASRRLLLMGQEMGAADSSFFGSKILRRVRLDAPTTGFVRPDGLEYCLDCWKSWMRGDPDRDMGVVTMRGLTGDDSRNIDSGEAQQDNDNRIGAATDAAISDLSVMHGWAIKRACSIASVWRFPSANFIEVAAEAREELTKKLKKNICTSVLF
jgi:hypothetical protein